ncbi:MAG: DUF2254 domain-containing protein [Solirubrobacterales bacterium]
MEGSSQNASDIDRDLRAAVTATRYFKLRLWLVNQLWIPVLMLNLLAVALSFVLPQADDWFGRTAPITNSVMQSLYAALAGSMITFTGIVFSALFIAAQIQTSAYSPRLAAQLRGDPVIMGTLVLSTATAAYSLGALISIDRLPADDRAPLMTVGFGLVLALATLAWFAALVQRAFENIQIGGILRTLGRKAWRAIDDIHPSPESAQVLPVPVRPTDGAVAEIEHRGKPGVLAAVDRAALVKLAEVTGGFVEVLPQVGEYISQRSGAVRIYDGQNEPTRKQVSAVFVLARQRTPDQDPAFVLRILVDIAIRALSAAINDPTTAVQTLDRVEALLIRLYERHPGPTYVVDATGKPRGLVHAPTWIEYFELGTTEARIYGANSVQIHRRLRAMHLHLLDVTDGPERERVELEIEQLDREAAEDFSAPHDIELAREPDRLGIGGS